MADKFNKHVIRVYFHKLQEILGRHILRADSKDNVDLSIGEQRITVEISQLSFVYKRFEKNELKAEVLMASNGQDTTLGLFPIPPIKTPKEFAKNVYLKFKTPLIIGQTDEVEIYAKMPIEIGVYRQSQDEEILIDVFSVQRQRYSLYGVPENGVVCRYMETEISTSQIEARKFEEALVKIHVKNDIDNIIKISKVIIPMVDIILDHSDDVVQLPGKVEMHLDSAFGKDVVNVQISEAKVKRSDKTSELTRKDDLTFLMDSGY